MFNLWRLRQWNILLLYLYGHSGNNVIWNSSNLLGGILESYLWSCAMHFHLWFPPLPFSFSIPVFSFHNTLRFSLNKYHSLNHQTRVWTHLRGFVWLTVLLIFVYPNSIDLNLDLSLGIAKLLVNSFCLNSIHILLCPFQLQCHFKLGFEMTSLCLCHHPNHSPELVDWPVRNAIFSQWRVSRLYPQRKLSCDDYSLSVPDHMKDFLIICVLSNCVCVSVGVGFICVMWSRIP